MTRTSTILTIALVSSILTPVVVKATGAGPEAPAVQQAKVEAAPAAVADGSVCGKRVKVVYAGYGEAHSAACPVTAEMRR